MPPNESVFESAVMFDIAQGKIKKGIVDMSYFAINWELKVSGWRTLDVGVLRRMDGVKL